MVFKSGNGKKRGNGKKGEMVKRGYGSIGLGT
jgi:hypothetical protein